MASPARKSPPSIATTPPTAVLLLYPITLLVGSLFSIISPTAQGSRDRPHEHVDALAASTPNPVNYFARKNNIFNLYFVKIGWLWTTLAFASLLVSQKAYTAPSSQRSRRVAQTALRYSLATAVWYLTTQWFFGPPIIDRGFVVTGGKCERAVQKVLAPDTPVSSLETLFTASACKAAGGVWAGGHDVSGHVFMLVLATAMLGFEVWGVVMNGAEAIENGGKEKKDGEGEDEGEQGVLSVWSLRFAGGVAGLGWWMLFMTSIWFHTWLEKWTGLSIALGTLYIIYILPRTVAPWRDIVGTPGV
ncbi:hypothetical protein ASPWEDRAFT_50044 [Aspergillus wentii DTO 134E9]|uniref:Acyl-coenzyme A diphosphatase SCS3 n=1 Tax=Aspergillus wentii DTO 134E9 TaxID=1073089 RepID=A0A1L9RNS5_ASPWE|nr:uncharacterized protein ASPWEDRAFT_50044 [Aspergillus wentii DTO 134E9]KAI9934275.1 hypothetical protein MW887_005349 [Aspergillus wentii]OJJ36586.1 hypothetical protein ASPWEDRAFT_50044 [Aspergillus wentii DTO 134E9]